MYINNKLTKFKKYLINPMGEKIKDFNHYHNLIEEKTIKYVFDHKLRTLNYIFFSCENITSIDFVGVDTSNVLEMEFSFSGCRNIRHIDLSCFNTKSLKSIYNCFFGSMITCELNLSNFNFDNIRKIGAIFGRAGIRKIILSKKNSKKLVEENVLYKNISYI